MSSKRVIKNQEYFADPAVAGIVTGESVDIHGIDRVSFGVFWSGDLLGVLQIQVSNDGTIFTDSKAVATEDPAGVGGASNIELETAAGWCRFNFAYTSGTGGMTAKIVAKGYS